jgi:ribosomal protein S18 acetylase RimI-like enzyme
MTITIERAQPADAPDLVDVQIRAFHDDARIYPNVEIGGPPGYDSIEVTLGKIEHNEFYKISEDGQIIGGMVIFNRGEGHYHLDLIFVDPTCHNRGIGTQAMRFIEQQHPAATWTLDTPAYATRNHHFYEKLGYRKVREFLDGDFALYAYEKQVQASD